MPNDTPYDRQIRRRATARLAGIQDRYGQTAADVAPPLVIAQPSGQTGTPLPALVPAAKADAELQRVLDAMSAGERNAECCICFEPLNQGAQAMLTTQGRPACAHFFHASCAHALRQSSASSCCPICRAVCDGVRLVPTVSDDPSGWFFCVDVTGEGYLTKREVLNVLVAQFAVDAALLEAHFDVLFEVRDRRSKSGAWHGLTLLC
jgi:hypothetical protein